jgi:hypothetical protein
MRVADTENGRVAAVVVLAQAIHEDSGIERRLQSKVLVPLEDQPSGIQKLVAGILA